MPRLAPGLPVRIPEPVHAGSPTEAYPLEWSVYRWIEGAPPASDTVTDWLRFGADLAGFVRKLHGTDLMGTERAGELSWYRGGSLRDTESWVVPAFAASHPLGGDVLDLDRLERWWREALALPDSSAPHVWLHGDLRPGNLLAQDGRLHAVIDFGALSVGAPDAEHAAVWDLPADARLSYRAALDLDEETWLRARGWAITVAMSGIPYYWDTFPEFVAECRARLEEDVQPHLTMPMGSLFRSAWGGSWVGGRVTLTTEVVSFSANGLNRIAQSGTLDVRVPLAKIIDVDVRPGFFTNIVAITTPESVVKVRCHFAADFAKAITAARDRLGESRNDVSPG